MVNKLEKCLHPMLAKRDQNWFCRRIQAEMKRQGLGYLILQTPCNVFYSTGYMPLVGSSAAVVPAEGDVHLIISTLESADAYASTQNVDVREFMSWEFIDNGTEASRRDKGDVMDPDAIVHMCLDLIQNTPMDGRVGIEMGSVGHQFFTKLTGTLPEGMVVDGSTITRNCRVVKCQWEIDMLRLAAQEADKAWSAMIPNIKPGMPAWKLDAMFAYEAGKLNLEHGTASRGHSFIPAAGPYFGLCGMPRGYILQAGDVIKFDVGFQYLGYWSDIARTFAVGGTAPDEVLEIYDTLYHANRLGVSMLKPGVPMRDIYSAIREDVEKSRLIPQYPRGHMGHSIGSGWGPEEFPTISPSADYVLEPNMVVCLETPYSATGGAPAKGGFNLEDTHLITADGHESFTTVPDNIFWNR